MGYFLLKTEPSVYAFADLVRDKKTVWDGISNALALKHLRTMMPGDELIIYHSGDERAAVGTATVASQPYADPKQEDEKRAVVDIRAGKAFTQAVTLAEMKAMKGLAGWELFRMARLSVVPATKAQFDEVCRMGGLDR